jgi:uncharacterized membrane protein
MKKNRIWELDFLRGLAILLVVFDHVMVDAAYVFVWDRSDVGALTRFALFANDYLDGSLRAFWRPAFLFLLFFISGICCGFSRNNLFRSVKLGLVAGGVSLVTYLADLIMGGGVYVMFGVLHALAVITLFYALAELAVRGLFFLIEKKKPIPQPFKRFTLPALCFALAGIFTAVHLKYNTPLSDYFYADFPTFASPLRGIFFFDQNWLTADYFPLFPFIVPFFVGAGIAPILYPQKKSLLPPLDTAWHKPITFAGRYSLTFYLAGQVAAIAILALITLALTGKII